MPSTLCCTITGRVQGVFFRAWTRDTALSLGLTGWVRNESDGNVELQAQGASDSLATLEDKLHDGPPHARVDGVICRTMDIPQTFHAFKIIP